MTSETLPRVIIYIRVSTKLQENKYSLSAQVHELTKYAKSQNWQVIDTIKDVESGGKLDKKGLMKLLDMVEEGRTDIVLVVDQDRLSRLDTAEWEYLKSVLREHKVKIAEPGHTIDLENENDELFSDIKNLFAKREKREIVKKMMRGKRQYTREGKVWGVQPEEYIYDKKEKTISVNPSRAWIIPYIDDLYINQGLGVSEIARRLNLRSKTSQGKRWTGVQVLKKLKNPCYHGDLVKNFSNGERVVVPDVYPKLRTREDFNAIEMRIKGRYSRKPAEAHFLRDVRITCEHCGKLLSVQKSGNGEVNGNKTYFFLKHVQHTHKYICDVKPYVNTKRVEKRLYEAVKDILNSEELACKYIDASHFDGSKIKDLEKSIKLLEKQVSEVNAKLDRILDLYVDGLWSKEKLDTNRIQLTSELSEIEAQLDGDRKKLELIRAEKFNYDSIVSHLSVVNRMDRWMTEADKQEQIGRVFPTATFNALEEVLTLRAKLPDNVSFDVKLKLISVEELREEQILEEAKIRYDACQKYLNENPGTTLNKLSEIMRSNHSTLEADQQRFGKFKNLGLAKGSKELRAERLKVIKTTLKKHPDASGRELEKLTGINRKMIYKLLKEEGLKV